MKIAIFPNTIKKDTKKFANQIAEFFHQKGIQVYAEDHVAKEIEVQDLAQADPAQIDFMITLGGDGTILRVIHRHWQIQAPVLAINLGSLGFMADITTDQLIPSLQNLIDGNYTIQERLHDERDNQQK